MSSEVKIELTGTIDERSISALHQRFDDQPLTLDLSGVETMDADAVVALVKLLQSDGCPPISVVPGTPLVRRTLELTGLADAIAETGPAQSTT